MTDSFDRVAARALGLSMALRPRFRSRFEPESLASEFENVATGVGEDAQPLASTPTWEAKRVQPNFGAETPARIEEQIPSADLDAAAIQMRAAAASSDEREKPHSLQGPTGHASTLQDRSPLPPVIGWQPAAFGPAPEPVDSDRSFDPPPFPGISERGDIWGRPDASSDFDRPSGSSPENDATLASPPPMSQFFAREAPGRSTTAPDPAASPYKYDLYSRRQESGRGDQGQPVQRRQVAQPAPPVAAVRAPEIEITIGRLEIRAEPKSPARSAKPFQPHLDLAA